MSEKEERQSKRPFGLSDDINSTALLIGILLTGLAGLSFALWSHYGGRFVADGKYQITAESIEITPLPQWILSDVRSEAMMLGSLSDLNIRQKDLTLRIAQAFSLHPWVDKVKRVSKKHPARVVVQLQYRKPAAVVELAQGLYPVDTEGVLLPTGDFRFVCKQCGKDFPVDVAERSCPDCQVTLTNIATQYPRLWASESSPLGQPGAPWGDPRIHSGARLATLMGPLWERLGFLPNRGPPTSKV